MNHETVATSPETLDNTKEIVKETEQKFLDLVEEVQIPLELIDALKSEILPGIEIEIVDEGPCLFQNVGYRENGVPDGRYRIVLSQEILKGRAKRLAEVVPTGQENRLAIIWITAHELGHALESAYTHVHQYVEQEGTFAGLPAYPYPTIEFLDKFPDTKAAPNPIDADRIERERRAEGFAQEMLVRELQSLGIDNNQIIAIAHKLYEPLVKRAEALKPLLEQTNEQVALADVYDGRIDGMAGKKIHPQFAKHELGYAYPMPVGEIAYRYQVV